MKKKLCITIILASGKKKKTFLTRYRVSRFPTIIAFPFFITIYKSFLIKMWFNAKARRLLATPFLARYQVSHSAPVKKRSMFSLFLVSHRLIKWKKEGSSNHTLWVAWLKNISTRVSRTGYAIKWRRQRWFDAPERFVLTQLCASNGWHIRCLDRMKEKPSGIVDWLVSLLSEWEMKHRE